MADTETLTVGDVVRRWGRKDSTVRRHLRDGRIADALPPGEGREAWSIPLASVIALYGPEPDTAAAEVEAVTSDADKLRAEVETLRATLTGKDQTIAALEVAVASKDETIAELQRRADLAPMLTQLADRLAGVTKAAAIEAPETNEVESLRAEVERLKAAERPRRRWWPGRNG